MKFSIRQVQFLLTTGAVMLLAGLLLATQPPVTRAVFEDNAVTFKTKCALCHGLDGSGNTATGKAMKVRDLGSAEVQKMTDAQLNTLIRKGKNKMPAFGGSLNAEQIKGLVAHLRSLAKK